MSLGRTGKHSSWAYAEDHSEDDPVLQAARRRAAELGSAAVSSGTAAALSVLAATLGARALAEVGTGVGVSGTALLRGAAKGAVLTSIDADANHIAAAAETFRAEGIPASKTRLITGDAARVLPRLNSGGYDLVFIDAEPQDVVDYAAEGIRLIRSGGALIINDALDQDRVPRPAVRDESTQAMREVERLLRDDQQLVTALLPAGTGLLVAVKGAEATPPRPR